MSIARNIDDDRPPRRFPRLSSKVESIPRARALATVLGRRLTDGQASRLRRDMAIYFAIEGGMSFRMVAKIHELTHPGAIKAYRRIAKLRKPA